MNTIDKVARTPLSHVLLFVAACTLVRIALHPYLTRTPPHRRLGAFGALKFVNEVLDALIYAGVFVFMIIRPFGVQTFTIPTGSMENTLLVNDFIIANKWVYRTSEPKIGDIVVFKPPRWAKENPDADQDYIKRLVGAPGDVLEIRGGKLYRNGRPVDEPYLKDQEIRHDWKLVRYEGSHQPWQGQYIPVTLRHEHFGLMANYGTPTARPFAINGLDPDSEQRMQELIDAPPAAVPPGHFLMMGDNRNGSFDSRGWGLVPRRDIIGRSEFIWLPLSRIRKTR